MLALQQHFCPETPLTQSTGSCKVWQRLLSAGGIIYWTARNAVHTIKFIDVGSARLVATCCTHSIARKLSPAKIKLTVKDYFALHRSRKQMTKHLTAKAIRYAMEQIKKGTSTSVVAVQIGATLRHVRRLWTEFCTTGSPHVPKMLGRPATRQSPDEVQMVLDEHRREDVGVLRTAMNLRKDHDISYARCIRS